MTYHFPVWEVFRRIVSNKIVAVKNYENRNASSFYLLDKIIWHETCVYVRQLSEVTGSNIVATWLEMIVKRSHSNIPNLHTNTRRERKATVWRIHHTKKVLVSEREESWPLNSEYSTHIQTLGKFVLLNNLKAFPHPEVLIYTDIIKWWIWKLFYWVNSKVSGCETFSCAYRPENKICAH